MQLSGINSLSANSSFINSKLIVSSNSTSRMDQIRKKKNNENDKNKMNEIEDFKIKKQSFCQEPKINDDNDLFIGMNKEVYERLKNEKIDFIQTLLRLKKKMIEEKTNKTPEKQKININKNINISLTESKNNCRNSNIQRFPTFTPMNILNKIKSKPIKVKNSFKHSFVSEQRKILKNYNKSDILIPKTKITLKNSFINNEKIISNYISKRNLSSKKKVNQKKAISSTQINKVNKGNNKNNIKKRNKEIKIEKHNNKITTLSNNSTCLSNASINPMIEIPSATINLFD